MDSSTVVEMIFNIVGGLGIFLYGMKSISEGMQAVAGDKLRKLINAVTNNRLIASGVGTLVTAIIQSSSVTTVIVVGMVNAGLMTLRQSIGVILGANVGTTITAWILVIKISKYGLPLIGVFAIIYLFTKREKLRYTAMALFGLGMIFFGLALMKTGFSPLKEMPQFHDWFTKFSPDSYIGVMKCVLIGSILTAIVQSSSATIGITMSLAFTGVIDFPTAAALVLGQNVGTTITAWLASLGASTNAKRASYAHIFFNIVGVLWVTIVFSFYLKLVSAFILWKTGHNPGDAVMADGEVTYPYIMTGIAITHTCFNVLNTIIFLPFVGHMSNVLLRLVPDKKVPEKPRLTALDIRLLDAPALGIEQSKKEIYIMADRVVEMLNLLKNVLANSVETTKAKQDEIFNQEQQLDLIQKEIVEFTSHIMTGNVPHEVAEECREQLRMADEYESISDYVTNILKFNLKLRDIDERLLGHGQKAIIDLHNEVAAYITMINQAVKLNNRDILVDAQNKDREITHLMKKYRSEHLTRVENGQATAMKSLIYTDMLNAYRRIKDHSLNIAEVIAGEK